METISFARGVPAPECLPVTELADCARVAIGPGPAALSYGPAGGYGPLREWLAARHGVDAARVVVTSGSLQGLAFAAAELLPGVRSRVLVEEPTYDRPLRALAELDADVVPLRLDPDGLDPDALEEVLRTKGPARFLYTIPTFQNPTGRTLTLERRRRVLELAREHDLLIVEDDPYGLVRFGGRELPTIFELAGGEGVVYSSSFSKTIAPGVRVGYLVMPEELAARVEARAANAYISPPFLTQATVFEFLRRGLLEPNLLRVRELLRARRDAMLEALERDLPGAEWSRPEGGYFLWLDLPGRAQCVELLARAAEAGVTFVPGPDFFPSGDGGHSSIRLAYSFEAPEAIREGVARLADLLAPVRHAAPATV